MPTTDRNDDGTTRPALEDRLRDALHTVAATTQVPAPPIDIASKTGATTTTTASPWTTERPTTELPAPIAIDAARPTKRASSRVWRALAAAALLVLLIGGAGLFGGARHAGDGDGSQSPAGGGAPTSIAGSTIPAAALAPSSINQDHWHAAYGVYLCDHFAPVLIDQHEDRLGIHTHGEGVIHIHPLVPESSGPNAQLGLFAAQVGLGLHDDQIQMPDGTTYRNGDTCPGTDQKMTLRVYEWIADQPDLPPQVFTRDLTHIPFTRDRTAFTIAMVPDGVTPPMPPSVAELDHLTDVGVAGPCTVVCEAPGTATTIQGAG